MAALGAEAAIYEALANKVSGIAEAMGFDPKPGGDVAFPGVSYTPKTDQSGKRKAYLAVTYMPNGAGLDGLPFDSDTTHQGLLQISVFCSAGAGLVKPLQQAAQVVAAFPPGLRFVRNGVRIDIDRKPEVAGSLQESDLVQIPITIAWRASVPAA